MIGGESTSVASAAFASATARRRTPAARRTATHGQDAGHLADRAVRGQLPDEGVAVEPKRATEAEDGYGDGKVECALYPFLEGTHNADQSTSDHRRSLGVRWDVACSAD